MVGTDPEAGGAALGGGDDDRRDDVAGRDRPRPAFVPVAVDRLPLGDDVALRLAVAMPLVERPQAVLERAVRNLLQPGVEGRRHPQAALVQHLGAVLLLEMLAHLLDEKRRDARRLRRLAARDDRLQLGFVGPRLRDVPLVGHPLQHDVAPGDRAFHVDERALTLGELEQAGDQRRFLEVEILVRLVEVQPRRRLDAVGAVREVHLVAVDREDLLLGVSLLDLNREDDLLDLPLQRFGKGFLTLGGEAELVFQVARQLLRQGAGALRAAALDDVDRPRHGDAPDVDAEVAIEFRVLGRDDPLTE